ncbi:M60 family metallopeptidase [Carnobacterium gallinarum]|uniref:M60 family metallopeptidase n=1 Tax=Carnobacterium gallinarum TaxID=2749 RepID=UPI00054FA7C0|nr:M60 family metallopeptidase [Carnobacterium gallinarum]
MKKISLVAIFLIGFMMLMTQQPIATATENQIIEITGKDTPTNVQNRLGRRLAFSEWEATGFYVKKGESVTITVTTTDEFKNNLVKASIGAPRRDTVSTYSLVVGENTFIATSEGPLFLSNSNKGGKVHYEIKSELEKIPFFKLGETTNAEFQEMLKVNPTAKAVQLVSRKAILTVDYAQVKKYKVDPTVLMTYYDTFLDAEDKISGVEENGREDYLGDPHFQHFVTHTGTSAYMYATNGHMGFNGDAAANRLLTTTNGWGPWHEAGHQHQQPAWTWAGVSEVTVNLYSMTAQEATSGKRSAAVDKEYPGLQTYFKKTTKDYETLNVTAKLAMFWQLKLTFGNEFYPQLHQIYRVMPNSEKPKNDEERKQKFMLETSKLANVNLTTFYEMWGMKLSEATKAELAKLPPLTKNIWENSNTTEVTLDLPADKYEYNPALYYLKKSVLEFNITDNAVKVVLDSNWLANYNYLVTRNNQIIAEVDNGEVLYGVGKATAKSLEITTPDKVKDNDIVEIFVLDKTYRYLSLAKLKVTDQTLFQDLNALFTDAKQTALVDSVSQDQLSTLLEKINTSDRKDAYLVIYQKAQQLFVNKLVAGVKVLETGVQINLASSIYQQYSIEMELNNEKVSSLDLGVANNSTIGVEADWLVPAVLENTNVMKLKVPMADKTYTIYELTTNDTIIEKRLDALFTDATQTQLTSTVTQTELDQVKNAITSSGSTHVGNYTKRLEKAQQLFLQNLFKKFNYANNKVEVTFANDLYKNYTIVLIKNGSYASDIAKGAAHYSLWNSTYKVWTTGNVKTTDAYFIEVRLPGKTYRIKN